MKLRAALTFFSLLVLILGGCNNNDAQREFEREAYQNPNGITETDFHGNVNSEDPDDWRVSPLYTGLVTIDPPLFPNPVPYGTIANLNVYLNGTTTTSYLELGYLDPRSTSGRAWVQIQIIDNTTDLSVNAFQINPAQFGSDVSTARGTYRLIVFDGNQEMITYGDITIE